MIKNIKISSVIYLMIIIIILLISSLTLQNTEIKIEVIELEGNVYLSKDKYINFAKLNDDSNFEKITLSIIKDRILKHPYIESANVKYENNNKVTIIIKEKNFLTLLMYENNEFLLSSKLEVLPVLTGLKDIDYPIISNPMTDTTINEFDKLDGNKDAIIALKIIEAIKLDSPELLENLSEINLRLGGDIVVYFSNIAYPVVIGRGSEIEKILYFNDLWKYLKENEINKILGYIDLRFNNYIYLGIDNHLLEDKGNQI